jgi:hypothetical protein
MTTRTIETPAGCVWLQRKQSGAPHDAGDHQTTKSRRRIIVRVTGERKGDIIDVRREPTKQRGHCSFSSQTPQVGQSDNWVSPVFGEAILHTIAVPGVCNELKSVLAKERTINTSQAMVKRPSLMVRHRRGDPRDAGHLLHTRHGTGLSDGTDSRLDRPLCRS